MSEETYESTEIQPEPWYDWIGLRGSTTRTISFAVPIDITRQRLENAFQHAIAEPGDFFSPTISYQAKITGNDIDLEYSKSGRSRMNFNMKGYISEDSNGSLIEMSVRTSPGLYLMYILLAIIIVLSHPALEAWALVFIIFSILIGQVIFSRVIAADRIAELLEKIITGEKF